MVELTDEGCRAKAIQFGHHNILSERIEGREGEGGKGSRRQFDVIKR